MYEKIFTPPMNPSLALPTISFTGATGSKSAVVATQRSIASVSGEAEKKYEPQLGDLVKILEEKICDFEKRMSVKMNQKISDLLKKMDLRILSLLELLPRESYRVKATGSQL